MKAKLIIDGKEIEIEISEEEAKVLMGKKLKRTGYERVGQDEKYFVLTQLGNIGGYNEDYDSRDDEFYAVANYYSDETVAKNNARADRLYRQLRRFAVEHREKAIDWGNVEKNKYNICCTGKSLWPMSSSSSVCPDFGGIYFDSEEACELAIDTFRDELIWYFSGYQDSL